MYVAQSIPLPKIDDSRLQVKEEPYLYVVPRYVYDLNSQRAKSEDNYNEMLDDSVILQPNSVSDDLKTSQHRYRYRVYRPYIKYAQISRRSYSVNRPLHPLSNYANDYDRFPTVA